MNKPVKKQIKVIAESSANIFEKRANQLLSALDNPQIIFDRTRPYTIYVVYDAPTDPAKQKGLTTMRNVRKYIEKGEAQLRKCDQLTLREIDQLYTIAKDPKPHHDVLFEMMTAAFHFGYAAGIRAEQRKRGKNNG